MSSFDEAFRNQAAQQHSRTTQQQWEQEKRQRIAQVAAPLVHRLLREFVQRLHAEAVPPQQVKIGHVWSPAGYVVSETYGASSLLGLALVTPDVQLFTYSSLYDRSGFVPVTPDSILTGDVGWWRTMDMDDHGQLLVDVGYEKTEWRPFEQELANSLAAMAVKLMHGASAQQAPRSDHRAAIPQSRAEQKLESMKMEIDNLKRTLEAEKARNPRSRSVTKLATKISRLTYKYNKLAQRGKR